MFRDELQKKKLKSKYSSFYNQVPRQIRSIEEEQSMRISHSQNNFHEEEEKKTRYDIIYDEIDTST